MRRLGWWTIAIWPLAALGQTPTPNLKPASAPAADSLTNIRSAAESAQGAFDKVVNDSFSDEGRFQDKPQSEEKLRAADEAFYAQMQSLMDRALTLGRLHLGDPDGLAALEWVAMQTSVLPTAGIPERGDAAYRLLADAPVLDGSRIALAIVHAKHIGPRCPEIEPFLRSVLSRSRQPYFVTLARFCLGGYLAETARMHDRLSAPISGPELTKSLTKDRLARLRAVDGPKLRSEAEALLEQVISEHADVDVGLVRLGLDPREASSELYRIRCLGIGQPAPELLGEDLDGVPIRLSDFRGKVVVLSFWPTAPADYLLASREKHLAAVMKGRPFVLLGATYEAGDDRAEAKKAAAEEGIAWRSFWAGWPGGATLQKWDARSWQGPTVFTIDAEGIIRDDLVGREPSPAAFEPLVRSAEEAAR